MVWRGLRALFWSTRSRHGRRRCGEHHEQFSRNVPLVVVVQAESTERISTSGNQKARVPGGNVFSMVPGNIVQLRADLVHIWADNGSMASDPLIKFFKNVFHIEPGARSKKHLLWSQTQGGSYRGNTV
jgi:hypothetical protein